MLINDLVELARDGQASFHIEDVRLDLVAERVAARAAGRASPAGGAAPGTPLTSPVR